MPIDDGHLILSQEEAALFIQQEPITEEMIRPYSGGKEFINNSKRFCLWLVGVNPSNIKQSRLVLDRIAKTRKFRELSNRDATKKLALVPSLFGEIRQPENDYLLIPKVSSENRAYIPIGFMKSDAITNGSALIIPEAGFYEFGVLTSSMHMAWMRYTCGRMKSDYQYSASLVYNNFPWPDTNYKQKDAIVKAANEVINARAKFPDSTLAVLYDRNAMPPELAKAHTKLDRLVEKTYGKSFENDASRVAFLFKKYQQLTSDLFTKNTKKKKNA
ncbi:MAG: hypothetical protein FVQ80_14325 [Planctomycetes bacterium]|nr:hypothetical protein [Planctomycetota bacterium]